LQLRKILKKDTQILLNQTPSSLGELYDKYAGMLLGYIFDIVEDSKIAEQHLVSIYSGLSLNYKDVIPEGENAWCYLQHLAQKHLSGFANNEVKPEPKLRGIDLSDRNNRNNDTRAKGSFLRHISLWKNYTTAI
jgi:hypothetical protein